MLLPQAPFSVILVAAVVDYVYMLDNCTRTSFYRRSDKDNLEFAGSLIEEINQVDMRVECFSQCLQRALCNLVLYNPLTRSCRLHSDALESSSDGVNVTGWQYYGVACAHYRLEYIREGVDVINTEPQNVCNVDIIASDDNVSSCYAGASWERVTVKCLRSYFGKTNTSLNHRDWFTEDLTFDLAPGMKMRMRMSADTSVYNEVRFGNANGDTLYLLSLRWLQNRALFTTKIGGVFGPEENKYGFTVNNINDFVLDVHITESTFQTYIDNTLWLTNQMRGPLTGVRRVVYSGVTALHLFKISYLL